MRRAGTDGNQDPDAARGPMDRAYFLLVWALMVAGVVFVFSASFPNASRPDEMMVAGNPYYHLVRHSIYVGIALLAMLGASMLPLELIRRAAVPVFAVTLILMLMAVFSPWGVSHGGAPRWLNLPGIPEFQPSELAKFALIMLLAGVLARKDEERDQPGSAYLAVMLITGVVIGILFLQRDQGMATIFAFIAVSLLLFGGMHMRTLLPLVFGGMSLALLIAILTPYREKRLLAFIDPENADPDDAYHILNMLAAQARGGVTGTGLGMSPDKWGSLPAPHTDSIFSVIGGEMGMVGAVAVMVLVLLLARRGAYIARRARSPYGFYLVAGVTAMLCLQGLAHVAVNTSCMPCTGLTLPFISAGGTSLLSASISAGFVLAVSRYTGGDEP